MKKWFERNKDKIFIWVCVGLIAIIILLVVLFQRNDVDNMKDNNKADISIVEDENNLNIDGFSFNNYTPSSSSIIVNSNINIYDTNFVKYFDDVSVTSIEYEFYYFDLSSLKGYLSHYNLDYNYLNLFCNCPFENQYNLDFSIVDSGFNVYCFYSNSITYSLDLLNNSNRYYYDYVWDSDYSTPIFDFGFSIDLNFDDHYFCLALVTYENFYYNDSPSDIYTLDINFGYDYPFVFSFDNYTRFQYDDLQTQYDDLQTQYDNLINDGLYQGGYNNGYNVGKSDGYDESLQRVYANNPFYNARLNYYFTLSSTSYAFTKIISDNYLNGSTFIQPVKILQSGVNSNAWQSYVEDTQLGYYELIFSRSWSYVNLAFLYQCNVGNSFDYALTFYCDDGTQWTYHNSQYVATNDNPDYFQFVVDFSNNLNGKMVNKVTWRRQYSYEISTISNNEYQNGFVVGSQDGYAKAYKLYDNLQTQYNNLDVNYNTLLNQYNTLLHQSEYSFSELFWSISAVPMGVLTSAFNVNVLGVNLRGIITGLFTALLLIWLFKKLF